MIFWITSSPKQERNGNPTPKLSHDKEERKEPVNYHASQANKAWKEVGAEKVECLHRGGMRVDKGCKRTTKGIIRRV